MNTPQEHTPSLNLIWPYRYNILAFVIIMQALTVGLLVTSFSFWVDPWANQFNVDRSDVMLIATLYSLVVGAAGPIAGSLIDRFEARYLITCGLAALGLGCILISFSIELWQIMAVYVLFMPLAMSLAGPVIAQALAARWFPDKSGFAIGLSTLGLSLGGVVLPIVVTTLMESTSWRHAHQVLALIMFGVTPIAWLILSAVPDASTSSLQEKRRVALDFSLATLLRSPGVWVLILLFSPMYFALAGFQYNVAPFANDAGITPAKAAVMVSTMSIALMCGKVAFGWLMDKFDYRYVYTFSLCGMSAAFFLLALSPASWIIAAVVLLGFFGGSILPVKGALVLNKFGAAHYGRAVGILMPFLMCAAAVSPLAVGWAREYSGSYGQVFFLLGCLLLPGLILIHWLGLHKDR